MVPILNFLDGKFVAPIEGGYLDNFCPRDGSVMGRIPDSTEADINLAVAAARRAFPSWKKLSRKERSDFLNRIADRIEEKLEIFAEAESLDQGKPVHLARTVDIPRAIDNFRFFAGAILHSQEKAFQTNETVLNYTRRDPMGVAGLISPWNLPLYLLTWKIAPALATGNTVVAKPSEMTSMTAHLLAEVMRDVKLPAGVCNIIFGRGAKAGDALVGHPDVPLISFTGGTETAAAIGRRAAPLYKKMSLELGGKNPALIFADCDLDAAVETTLRSSFTNQGEICLCTSRLFIEDSIFESFTSKLVAKAKALQVGDPRKAESFMGPLVSREHRDKVSGFVERARAEGLKILCGGEMLSLAGELANGYYYPPTIIHA
ncbi:MAG: aldehyde dehydrogenase family protein, partial [Proteobacteria bacterium]